MRLSCTDSWALTSRYTCHMSMMFSFSERTSITLSPTARVWILNKFPPIFFGREKIFCQIFRVCIKIWQKNTSSSFWWLVAEYTHCMVMLSISFDSLDVFTSQKSNGSHLQALAPYFLVQKAFFEGQKWIMFKFFHLILHFIMNSILRNKWICIRDKIKLLNEKKCSEYIDNMEIVIF